VCVLVGGAVAPFAAPTAAQAENNSSNSTDRSGSNDVPPERGADVSDLRPSQINRPQNATNATNATNGSDGSKGRGGLYDDAAGAVEGAWNDATPNVPSTEKIANDTANWTEDHLLNASRGILSDSIGFVIGSTHPVNSGPHGIFGTPTNEPYEALYESVYGPYSFQYAIVILLILLFALVIVMPYAGLASGGTFRAVQACARIVAALVFIIFWWPIGTALAQFFDAIAVSVAPSATELTSSMEGLFKLSLGPVLASIAMYAVGFGEILALAFVYAFRQAALIVFQFAMPLLVVFAYAGPHRRVRSMASTITWQYFALLTMTIPTAFLMRVGFEVGWGFGLGPLGNALISMALLGLALATPFVFSIAAFRAPPSIQSLASGAAGAAAGAAGTARERLPSRGEDEDDGGDAGSGTGYTESTQYVESTQIGDRVAATDGGTNYTDATAKGPGDAPGGALPGDTGVTAERVRDFEKQTNGENGGSAAAKTKYHNEKDIIDVEGGVINEADRS
jgi:hypothetical protein